MPQILLCLLSLFFSLSGPASEGSVNFHYSSLAAEETGTANTFFHYTQAEIPAGEGLNVGSGVTSVGNLNASEAMFQLGIPKPYYVYTVNLERPLDYLSIDLGTPSRTGIPAWEVIKQTPPGSVGLPMPVPPAP